MICYHVERGVLSHKRFSGYQQGGSLDIFFIYLSRAGRIASFVLYGVYQVALPMCGILQRQHYYINIKQVIN
jgi:hypothetical protein